MSEGVTDTSSLFPVSVWYGGGRARAPMLSAITPDSRAEWGEELSRIRDLGFNAVRTWVTWAHCEPSEGDFRFDSLRLLSELADDAGLRVVVQVYSEAMPGWVEERFPEAAFVTQSGEALKSQSVPGLCTDHAGVREAMLAFYRAAAKAATEFPCFHAWDLWSEPHIVNWTIVQHVPNVQFCHCAHTCTRFRAWLRGKYETLGALGEAWGRCFTDWEQVGPPRFGTILTYTDFLDWKMFIFEKMAADLAMRARAVREVDPDHEITSHAAVPSGMTSPLSEWGGYGATDDFLMAQAVDRHGTSLYPKHSFPDRHWEDWKIDFALNFAQSASRRHGGFVIGELQAGPGARGVVAGDPVTAADHRRWIWTSVARGAKAVNLYAWQPMTSGYEAGGYGLVHSDGEVTDRAEESGRIARVISQHAATFAASRPVPAEVAILYNPLSQLMGGEQSCGPTSMHSDSLIGYQRVFARHGVPVDFVHRTDLESGDSLAHRLLIIPHPIMLTGAAAGGIRGFVERGGCALAEARLAWVDERGFTTDDIPGLGLSEAFGAREERVTTRERVTLTVTDSEHPALTGLEGGTTLTGAHFAEVLAPLSGREAETLAIHGDGSPAMIASKFGEGRTILAGTFLGLAARQWPEEACETLFMNLLDWAGVKRPFVTSNSESMAVHLHTVDEGRLLFLINQTSAPVMSTVSLPSEEARAHTLTELITETTWAIEAVGGELTVETELGADDVKVLLIRAA